MYVDEEGVVCKEGNLERGEQEKGALARGGIDGYWVNGKMKERKREAGERVCVSVRVRENEGREKGGDKRGRKREREREKKKKRERGTEIS